MKRPTATLDDEEDNAVFETDEIQYYMLNGDTTVINTPDVELQQSNVHANFVHYKEADITFSSKSTAEDRPKIVEMYYGGDLCAVFFVGEEAGRILLSKKGYLYGDPAHFEAVGGELQTDMICGPDEFIRITGEHININITVSTYSKFTVYSNKGRELLHVRRCDDITMSCSGAELMFDDDGRLVFFCRTSEIETW